MEKGRSLRLKRKVITSKTNPQTSKNLKISQTTTPDKPVVKVQAIVLSSDSDEEESQLTTHPPKQRNGEPIQGLAGVKVSDLCEGQDRSLQKLKDLIYKLSSSESVDPKSLTPFPPHPQVSEVSAALTDEKSDYEGRLHQTHKPFVPEPLPPFPKYCDTCRKSDCDISNITDPGASGTVDVCTVTLPRSIAQTAKNGSKQFVMEKQQDSLASHNQPSYKLPPVNVTRRTADSVDIDNSHLMRDRNSNLYSLQSRNRQTFPQSGAGNSIKTGDDNAQHPVPPCATELRSTSHNFFTHDHPQTSQSAGVVSSKSAQDSQGASSSKFAQRSPGFKVLEHNATESHTGDSMALSNNLQEKNSDKTVHKNVPSIAGSVAQGIENDKSAVRNQNSDDKKQIQKSAIGNQTEKELCGNQSSNKRGPELQSCPMCQMTFVAGTRQLDIDGHLASCLSTADDDFMW